MTACQVCLSWSYLYLSRGPWCSALNFNFVLYRFLRWLKFVIVIFHINKVNNKQIYKEFNSLFYLLVTQWHRPIATVYNFNIKIKRLATIQYSSAVKTRADVRTQFWKRHKQREVRTDITFTELILSFPGRENKNQK